MRGCVWIVPRLPKGCPRGPRRDASNSPEQAEGQCRGLSALVFIASSFKFQPKEFDQRHFVFRQCPCVMDPWPPLWLGAASIPAPRRNLSASGRPLALALSPLPPIHVFSKHRVEIPASNNTASNNTLVKQKPVQKSSAEQLMFPTCRVSEHAPFPMFIVRIATVQYSCSSTVDFGYVPDPHLRPQS